MNPCEIKKTPSGLVCLCHGAKAKWKDGQFYCIATEADVKGTDWKAVQDGHMQHTHKETA